MEVLCRPMFSYSKHGWAETGLGLSLSYDIIKAHGREIKVNSTKTQQPHLPLCYPKVKYENQTANYANHDFMLLWQLRAKQQSRQPKTSASNRKKRYQPGVADA